MKKLLIGISILFISIISWATEFTGKCVSVIKGDTVMVMREGQVVKIQLWGVDAPELEQPFGEQAKKYTESLILGKIVKVVIQDRWEFDNLMGKLYLDKTYINLEIIKGGLAWYYSWFAPNEPDLEIAEKEAQEKKYGLWKDEYPIQPCDWRSGRRTSRVKDAKEGDVCIVRSDKRYHRCSCPYAKYTPILTTVQIAKSLGYTPCEKCKPDKE